MPPAYTPSQKSAIAQFVSFTSVKESVAAKQLKAQGWNVEQAVDVYVSIAFIASPSLYYLSSTILSVSAFFWQHYNPSGFWIQELAGALATYEEENMELGEGISYTAAATPKRRLRRPPLVEYGLMGKDGRGQSIKLVPEVENDGEGSNQVSGMRKDLYFLKSYWKGLIKDYKDLYLSIEDRERIHNNQLRPMLQLWVENARDPIHWMTFENLPMLFRFALRRPLIPEQALIKFLDEIGVMDYLPAVDKSVEDVFEKQGCHVVEERDWHVSTKYKQRIPKGNALDGPLVTWVHDQPPIKPPITNKAKHKVSFALSSLSEEQQELIEDVANAIALCRSGGYTSEQTIDVLYEHFTGFDYDYLKYLPDIESGSDSPQSLAERIYEDTQEEAPSIVDDDDNEEGEDEDDEQNIIREVARSICLCRSGNCTPEQTVDMLYDQFIGYDYDYCKYLPEIASSRMSPNSLARRIYKDTETEAIHGVDEIYRDKGRQNERNTSDISQNEVSARHDSKIPKITIKFKFDIKCRFQNIYQQVLLGRTLSQEALPMFRSAAEKPDISDMELAKLMVEHDVPFDLFFSCEQTRPDKQISSESEEHCEAKSQINTIVGPLTPQDSRRTSKLLNPHHNPPSVARFSEPDTPREDSCQIGDNEPGATLPSQSHISGDDKTEMLIQALQMLVEPEPYDCLCIDDSSEEAELPSAFFEETPETAVGHKGREECSIIANPTTIARISDEGSDVERSKSGNSIIKDHLSGTPEPVGQTSFWSKASYAMRQVRYISEVRQHHLVPGSSLRARIRHETDIGRKWDDSNPDLRHHDRSDWEGCAQVGPGGPPDNFVFICEHSSSPECGETTALWGLTMPTSKARELGRKLGLRSDYINENFCSSTPNRDAARKMSKTSERRSIPYLKRKSGSPSPDHRMHKSRKGSEVILFAEDGDDQTSFVEKRLRAPTPMVQVRSRSRCNVCKSCICNCRQLEIGQPEMRSVSVLPSVEPSDPSTGAGAQSISETAELERKCRALSTYTPPVGELPGDGGPLDSDDRLPRLIRSQACLSSAPGEVPVDCSPITENDSPLPVKSDEPTDSSTIRTQDTPELSKEFIQWRIEQKRTEGSRNDAVSQGEGVGPEEQASPIQDDETVVLQPEAFKLSLLASASSVGQTLSSTQRDITILSPTDQPPIPLFDKSGNEWAGKDNNSELAVEDISGSQPQSRSVRNVSISTAFLPLTIGGLLEDIQIPAQNPHLSSDMIREHTSQPAVVARKCSVVTTMKSLTIDDEEIPVPASSHLQPRPSDNTESDSIGCTVEHVEDLSPANLSSGVCSSSLPNLQYGAPRPAVGAKSRSMHTTVEVVEAESRELPVPAALSRESTTASSNSVFSTVKHIEALSAGNVLPSSGNPFSHISKEVDKPIPVCPSSPRPAAAQLPTRAPVSLRGNDSTNSPNAFVRSMSIPGILPRANKSEQTVCKSPFSAASAPLKRRRTESNSSLIRPSARLRVSSPVRDSNMHQGTRDATDIQEDHPTIGSFPTFSSSAPVSHTTNIGQGHRHIPRKSRLLAKMDRYLARVARLPEVKVQQIPPWTQENVEAAAWKFRASPRVFLWSKRQDREHKNQHNANRMSYTRYFQNPSASAGKSSTTSSLNKLFDKYRDDPESPDTIGTAGTMKYLTDLTVSLDEPAVLAILTELSAPTMGELTRDGFLAGWRTLGADSLPKQTTALPHLRAQLSANPDYFRRVYKHTFLLARTPGQKGVGLDTAIEFWRLLFGSRGVEWRGRDGTDWLGLWCGFVEERWKKSVSKDMWDQTGVFALKSLEDGTMAWWSEDGAWPGVLDEFVIFVRERRGDGGEGMDVE
ncbi:Scaffold-type E3 ligase [Xylographa soralifera]|nr:Scaffold-type E3 ligase [Xylographa soralifera]